MCPTICSRSSLPCLFSYWLITSPCSAAATWTNRGTSRKVSRWNDEIRMPQRRMTETGLVWSFVAGALDIDSSFATGRKRQAACKRQVAVAQTFGLFRAQGKGEYHLVAVGAGDQIEVLHHVYP